ncbi:MAG: hypothetical protein AMXMBFR33_16330 [Candidatus Xenobia bacterium]
MRVLPRAESLALAVRQLGTELEQGSVNEPDFMKRSRKLTGELSDLYDTTTSWSAPTRAERREAGHLLESNRFPRKRSYR